MFKRALHTMCVNILVQVYVRVCSYMFVNLVEYSTYHVGENSAFIKIHIHVQGLYKYARHWYTIWSYEATLLLRLRLNLRSIRVVTKK